MHRVRRFPVLAAALLLAVWPAAARAQLAETGSFTQSAPNMNADLSRLPVSAQTDFLTIFPSGAPAGADTNADPLNTAEHELLHAVGFTVNYTRFANHVTAGPGANRTYTFNDGVTKTTLTPGNQGTHVTANELMQANQVVGQRYSALDANILNDSFGWNKVGLLVTPTFVGNDWDATNMGIVNQAIADLYTALGLNAQGVGTGGGTQAFAWTVVMNKDPNQDPPPGGNMEDPVPEASSVVVWGVALISGCLVLGRCGGKVAIVSRSAC